MIYKLYWQLDLTQNSVTGELRRTLRVSHWILSQGVYCWMKLHITSSLRRWGYIMNSTKRNWSGCVSALTLTAHAYTFRPTEGTDNQMEMTLQIKWGRYLLLSKASIYQALRVSVSVTLYIHFHTFIHESCWMTPKFDSVPYAGSWVAKGHSWELPQTKPMT